MFTSNRSFWLNLDFNTSFLRDDSGFRRERYCPKQSRLERDGWIFKKTSDFTKPIFEKTIREGWILRSIGWQGGAYELEQPGECKLEFPAWEWAEWDRKRLVWAEGGCLKTASLGTHKLGTVHVLCDFTGMVPAARATVKP